MDFGYGCYNIKTLFVGNLLDMEINPNMMY
jgi:hypothetical protein